MARNSPGYVIQILLKILKKTLPVQPNNLVKTKNKSKRLVLNFKRLIELVYFIIWGSYQIDLQAAYKTCVHYLQFMKGVKE